MNGTRASEAASTGQPQRTGGTGSVVLQTLFIFCGSGRVIWVTYRELHMFIVRLASTNAALVHGILSTLVYNSFLFIIRRRSRPLFIHHIVMFHGRWRWSYGHGGRNRWRMAGDGQWRPDRTVFTRYSDRIVSWLFGNNKMPPLRQLVHSIQSRF